MWYDASGFVLSLKVLWILEVGGDVIRVSALGQMSWGLSGVTRLCGCVQTVRIEDLSICFFNFN